MTSPRDEALTMLRRAREELEGVSAFITGAVYRPPVANEELDVWARVQQATNVVEKLMSELSTLASYEFAVAADNRKVSVRLAAERRAKLAALYPDTFHTPDGDIRPVASEDTTLRGIAE